MPDHSQRPDGPVAPGHFVTGAQSPADLLAVAWPQPLRLAAWATAAQAGLVSLDEAAEMSGVMTSLLEFGRVVAAGRSLVGVLAEPGEPPPVPLSVEVVTAAVAAGGVVLSPGRPGAALVCDADTLTVWELADVAAPARESLGSSERHLLEAVTEAAEVIMHLGISNPDPAARLILGRMQNLLDRHPLPPGMSGRARLLRDRAATLLVGIELALHPTREAPTTALDEARREVLVRARHAGRAALTTASNEQVRATS